MKGFIEVTNECGMKVIISLNSITYISDSTIVQYGNSPHPSYTHPQESYEQIKQLIKEAQG